jgi:hypothetical protein
MKQFFGLWDTLKAGAVYFALVFLAGFILGVVRTLLIEPVVGETSAVLLELPFMLTVSWIVCRWILKRIHVHGNVGARLFMGAAALVLLLAAEAGLSLTLAELSLQQHFGLYLKPAAQLGLLAQIVFALIPLIQLKIGGRW